MTGLELIAGINTLVTVLDHLNTTLGEVAAAREKAKAEGREFGLTDIPQFREATIAELDTFDAAIAKARG